MCEKILSKKLFVSDETFFSGETHFFGDTHFSEKAVAVASIWEIFGIRLRSEIYRF